MNILVIFSDQQHKYALGKRDDKFITPNLDKLCEEGILFQNGYSNNPVCGPYRGCLMSGQFTSRSGITHNGDPLPEDILPFAQALRNHGYQTCFVGKWHLGSEGDSGIPVCQRGGFEHFIGYQCYNGFDPNPPYYNDVFFYDENNARHSYQKHRTDVTTDLAVEKLRLMCKSKRPFFAVVGYQAPHYPEQPSASYAELYRGVEFDKTPDYIEIDPYTPTFNPPSPRPFEKCPDYQRYGGNMAEYKRLYAALCTQIDVGVGRIFNTLKELGVYDDTLIVYTSDHGDMQGSHGLKNKGYPYEKSVGVPFIIRCPGGRKGVVSSELVSAVDLYPTMLEATGTHREEELDGCSLFKYLMGETDKTQDYIIAEYMLDKPWRMIRTQKYKLICTLNDYSPIALYDMEQDEYELENLRDRPEHAGMIREMVTLLKEKTCAVKPHVIEDPDNPLRQSNS